MPSASPVSSSGRTWDEGVCCFNCSKKIGGVSTVFGGGRHHCRQCGHSFCQACSAKSTTIENSSKPVRVCDMCWSEVTAGSDERGTVMDPEEDVLHSWVRLKQGHSAVLDRRHWEAKYCMIDTQHIRFWNQRTQALVPSESCLADLVIPLTRELTLSVENPSAVEQDWILHICDQDLYKCDSHQCLRLKADAARSDASLCSTNLITSCLNLLVRSLAVLSGAPWEPEQQYGIKLTNSNGQTNGSQETHVDSTPLQNPSPHPLGPHAQGQAASVVSRERTLDQVVQGHVVQSILVGQVMNWGMAGSPTAANLHGITTSFDVQLTEDQFLIYKAPANQDTSSSNRACQSSRQLLNQLNLVNVNSECPVVDLGHKSFELCTDIFRCLFHCADEETLTKWVTAITDNIRRLRHVERSAEITFPMVISGGSRLRRVMISLGGTQHQIQRAFKCSYQSSDSLSMGGLLGISPSQLWFVSNGAGQKLTVSLSQIYNVTLEAIGAEPLQQLLSFAIQRHTTDEWRLSFDCPLEAEQAKVLVEQLWRETHETGQRFHQEHDYSQDQHTSSDLITGLQQKFHIPETEHPLAVLHGCVVMDVDQSWIQHWDHRDPDPNPNPNPGPSGLGAGGPDTGAACTNPVSTETSKELVSGVMAVFDLALVFFAEFGGLASGIGSLGARRRMAQADQPTGHRYLRLMVMSSQIEKIDWDETTCRLKLWIGDWMCTGCNSLASVHGCKERDYLEFHMVERGSDVMKLLMQVKQRGQSHHDSSRHSLTNLSNQLGSQRWRGWPSLKESLGLYQKHHPDTWVLDPDHLSTMPHKVELYGFDANGFRLSTPSDWRRALDRSGSLSVMRAERIKAITDHLLRTQIRSVHVVNERFAQLATRGFPPELRGQLWTASTFAISKSHVAGEGYYEALLTKVASAEQEYRSGKGKSKCCPVSEGLARDLDQIARDIDENRTESAHCLMFERNPNTDGGEHAAPPEYCLLSDALRRVCCAFAMRNQASIGYAQGMPSIVLHLLLSLTEEQAFWQLCFIFEDLLPDHFGYSGDHDVGKEACKTLLENLVDDIVPHFYRYLEEDGDDGIRTFVRGNLFEKWMNCLFCGESCGFPSETVQRILDLLFAKGFHMIFAVAIAIIQLQPLDPLVLCAERFCLMSENQKVIARSLHDADALIDMANEVALLPQLQPSHVWHAHAALVTKYQQFKLMCAACFEPGVECFMCTASGGGKNQPGDICPSNDVNRRCLSEQEAAGFVQAVPDVNWSGAETHGRTALHCATKALNSNMVRELIKHPQIKLDQKDGQGCTALHLVTSKTCLCRSGCSECTGRQQARLCILDLLVSARSCVWIQDRAGNTALHNSVTGAAGFPHAQMLLRAWAEVMDSEPSALGGEGLAPGLDENSSLSPEHEGMTGFLNRQNKVGYTALHLASHHGLQITVELLLKYKADVNAQGLLGEMPLHTAAQNNQYEIVEFLCWNGAIVEAAAGSVGWNALHIACSEDHRDAAYKLVVHKTLTQDNQKLVDCRTRNNFSPLEIAVFRGHVEMVDFLQAADAAIPKQHNPLSSCRNHDNRLIPTTGPEQVDQDYLSSSRMLFLKEYVNQTPSEDQAGVTRDWYDTNDISDGFGTPLGSPPVDFSLPLSPRERDRDHA